MSSPDSLVSYESFNEDDRSHTIRRHRSSACLGRRQTTSNNEPTHAHPFAQRASHHQQPRASLIATPSRRDGRVSARYAPEADTEFKYVGSIEQYGWKPGQVPLFLEWYPEKLDRRSSRKFFESGKEYIIGRAPTCDIFFQNSDAESGISGQHLTIKVPIAFIGVVADRRPFWYLGPLIEFTCGLRTDRRMELMSMESELCVVSRCNYVQMTMSLF